MGAALTMSFGAGGGSCAPVVSLPGIDRAPATGVDLRKVLVVDDERDLADLAQALLCHHGLEVTVAYDATEALRILADEPGIDAVFSDIMMPGMTGLQLADAVHCLYPSVRIVLTSGFTAAALMDRNSRSYLYVAKPYMIETVLKLLRA